MKTCDCRKGAIGPNCKRHALTYPAFYLESPRSRSLWQRFRRWVGWC